MKCAYDGALTEPSIFPSSLSLLNVLLRVSEGEGKVKKEVLTFLNPL